MPKEHTVRPGECTDSIAYAYGFFAETVWDAPQNERLRAERESKNVLSPGDVLTIPDKREKEEPAATGREHTFRRRGVPARIHLRFVLNDQPRSGVPYVLEIDGNRRSGVLDDQGELHQPVMPDARGGRVILNPGQPNEETHHLQLRRLEPIDTVRGQQTRLRNLGFYDGAIDGELGPRTQRAVQDFQTAHQLDVSGLPDEPTLARLLETHGC